MVADSQSRKYQLTINNMAEKGISHESIKQQLLGLKGIRYFCMADEVGLETHTPHTHVFLISNTPLRFSTLKRRFPEAHIEQAKGSGSENRCYIQKSGKWSDDPKADTVVEGTFEEWGELPDESGQGKRSDIELLYSLICDGKSNAEIMAISPGLALHISKMDKIRQDVLESRYRNEWRVLSITYIFGATGTGKTRTIMQEHGYSSVYRVTDYSHPFDRYSAEPVLCFDEFRSSIPIGDMLEYLDGYPINLPARYAQRVACFTSVFILSNIDLLAQYPNVQVSEPETWKAFLRRIDKVIEYKEDGSKIDHGSALDYAFPPPDPELEWIEIMDDEGNPFYTS